MNISRKRAVIYLVIASLLWSIGGLFVKLADWNAMAISGSRSGIAALVMLLYLRRLPNPRHIHPLTWLGAVFYAMLVTFFVLATKLTTSANAILLQFTSPIWVMVFSRLILKKKGSSRDYLTIAAVIIGMILFFSSDLSFSHLAGNAFGLISGICMSLFVLCMQQAPEQPAVLVPFLGNILTFLIAIPYYKGPFPSTNGWFSIAILGIFQLGIAYIFYTKAVTSVTSLEALLIPVLEPLLNPVWVLLFTGEKPALLSLAGGVIVLTAVIVHNIPHKEKIRSHSS